MRMNMELVFLAVGLLVAAGIPWRVRSRAGRLTGRVVRRVARSPWASGAACAVVCGLLSALSGLQGGLHEPAVHDEYAYLLQADTFLQGRLTNPAHPFWPHFESMHIIQQPTRQAKYPPGQGLAIAAGWALTGAPMAGVWLGCAACAAAVWWMLSGWLPPRWALLGGLLWGMKLAPSYWAQSFWGGAVACAGGALLCGGVRRAWDGSRGRDGLAMGVGAAILAFTRPWEGLVLTVFAGGALLVRLVVARRSPRREFARLCLPAAFVLVPAALFLGTYNRAVTGDWRTMPYAVHDVLYAANPTFLFQAPLPEEDIPVYRHAAMRDYYVGWDRVRWEPIGDLAPRFLYLNEALEYVAENPPGCFW